MPSKTSVPRISVLMPVYNGMPHIREAIASVLAQDVQDWELVISDDGSKDGTRTYLESCQDPRIRVHNQAKNLGIFGNLNFLLEQARAPIAKILCQDDALLTGALERVARFMEERPGCAVSRCFASGDNQRFSPGGQHELEGALPIRLEPAASVLAFATFGNLVGNLCKAACRPGLVLEAGGFDQKYPYAGDYEGWARVARKFGLDLQNEELVFERRHELQNSNLLNLKNELYPQLNDLLARFVAEVRGEDLRVLKRHWTIHFFPQRMSRLVRKLAAGEIKQARLCLQNLPLGISVPSVFAAYPIWKFNLAPARATNRLLFARILELNGESP
ncbi:MAG: glycosyltransferase family 2 protein [Panacagrimonas sp.]